MNEFIKKNWFPVACGVWVLTFWLLVLLWM